MKKSGNDRPASGSEVTDPDPGENPRLIGLLSSASADGTAVSEADLERTWQLLIEILDAGSPEIAAGVRTLFETADDAARAIGVTGATVFSSPVSADDGIADRDWSLVVTLDPTTCGLAPTSDVEVGLSSLTVDWRGETVEAFAAGVLRIDGVEVDVGLALPDFVLTGATRDEDGPAHDLPNGDAFLRRRGFDFGQGRRAPKLRGLHVVLAPSFERYLVSLEVENALSLGDAFRVGVLEIDATYEGGISATATGHAFADLLMTIGGQSVEFLLDGEIDPEGWRLAGEVFIDRDVATLGNLIASLSAENSVDVPAFLRDIALDDLGVAYASVDDSLRAHARISWDGTPIVLSFARHDGAFSASGLMLIHGADPSGEDETGDLALELDFAEIGGNATLIARYASDGHGLDVAALARALTGNAMDVPAHFTIASAFAALQQRDGQRLVLISADMNAGFDLGVLRDVPFVGGLLPAEDTIGAALRAVTVHPLKEWTEPRAEGKTALAALSALAPVDAGIPPKLRSAFQGLVDLKLGGGERKTTAVEFGPAVPDGRGAGSSQTPKVTSSASRADNVQWLDVGKSLGPLHLARLGFAINGGHLAVKADASLSAAGVTLSADGLGFVLALPTESEPLRFEHVTLDGFGVDFRRDPLRFAGAFLNSDGEFAGAVTISAPTFDLHAVGAMSMIEHAPSMFLYGVLDYPLGGPGFFYVEGFAAGFGLHRKLRAPTLREVRDFPLVSDVLGTPRRPHGRDAPVPAGAVRAPDIGSKLETFHEWIQPRLGEYFFAAGIRFTSFKVIEGFALVIVRASEHFDVDLIGTATYETPPRLADGVPALAHVELDLLGYFGPDEGIVSIEARLNRNSYVFSGACKIRGGFAFVSWFAGDNAGDFVLSVGGYAPGFDPGHYPAVDRVSIEYRVSSAVTLSGDCYLALTPSLVMAGFSAHARAHFGDLEVWFDLSVDFRIRWEPYHYDAHAHVAIGAKWHVFRIDAWADLHVWGPEFSGRAHVDWAICSFNVTFGAAVRTGPSPIGWDDFAKSFLPLAPGDATPDLLACRVVSGLSETVRTERGDFWIVNPADLCVAVASVVPLVRVSGTKDGPAKGLGIAPMDKAGLRPDLRLSLAHEGSDVVLSKVLTVEPRIKRFPPALWSDTLTPPRDAPMVEAYGEVVLTPKAAKAGEARRFPRRDLGHGAGSDVPEDSVPTGAAWSPAAGTATGACLADPAAAARRAAFLGALGFEKDSVRIGTRYAEGLSAGAAMTMGAAA